MLRDDLSDPALNVRERRLDVGFPPDPLSGIVGTLIVCSARTERGLRAHLRTRFAACAGCARSFWCNLNDVSQHYRRRLIGFRL